MKNPIQNIVRLVSLSSRMALLALAVSAGAQADGTGSSGGGSSLAQDFQSYGWLAFDSFEQWAPKEGFRLTRAGLAIILRSTVVLPVKQACLIRVPRGAECPDSQKRDAVFYARSFTIEVTESAWNDMTPDEKEAIVLHEYLGIAGIEVNQYQVSARRRNYLRRDDAGAPAQVEAPVAVVIPVPDTRLLMQCKPGFVGGRYIARRAAAQKADGKEMEGRFVFPSRKFAGGSAQLELDVPFEITHDCKTMWITQGGTTFAPISLEFRYEHRSEVRSNGTTAMFFDAGTREYVYLDKVGERNILMTAADVTWTEGMFGRGSEIVGTMRLMLEAL